VQLDPIKPVLKAPRSMLLKLIYEGRLSTFAFNFNLRCYNEVDHAWVGGRGLHSSTFGSP